MKQVMETYGQAIVAIIVMGAVLLFMRSFFYGGTASAGNAIGILANGSMEESTNLESEGVAFLQYQEKKLPSITFVEDYEIKTGIFIPVEHCFQAKSHEGEALLVEVTDIINMQEAELETYLRDGKEHFYFEVPGIYSVFVKATDKENRTSFAMVKIPVNKGESD